MNKTTRPETEQPTDLPPVEMNETKGWVIAKPETIQPITPEEFKKWSIFKRILEKLRYHPILTLELLLGVLFAALDVMFAAPAVAYVMERSVNDSLVYMIAVGLDLVGLICSFFVGSGFFTVDDAIPSTRRLSGIVGALIWLLIGTALAVMRVMNGDNWLQIALLVGLYILAGTAGLKFSSVISSRCLSDMLEGKAYAEHCANQCLEMNSVLNQMLAEGNFRSWEKKAQILFEAKRDMDKEYCTTALQHILEDATTLISELHLFTTLYGNEDERKQLWDRVQILRTEGDSRKPIPFDTTEHLPLRRRHLYQKD